MVLLLFITVLAGCNTTYVYDSRKAEGSVEASSKLVIETFNGKVSVIPSQEKFIRVDIEEWATGSKKDILRTFLYSGEITCTSAAKNGVTTITGSRKHPTQPNPEGITSFGVNFTVKVPVAMIQHVDVSTTNGSVLIDGINGIVTVNASNSSVELVRVKGDMSVTTSVGGILANDVEGVVRLVTSNGAVDVSTAKVITDAKILTSLGPISYHSLTDDLIGSYILETSNGDIDMFVRRSSKLTFRAETSNGAIFSELPITDTNSDANLFEGHLNNGGARVELKTSNADITIRDDGYNN